MTLDIIKKYALLIVTGVLIAYGMYIGWFLFNTVYEPLFLEPTVEATSNRFVIPDPAITSTREIFEAKQLERADVSEVHNPFVALPSELVDTENSTLNDDLGLGIPE